MKRPRIIIADTDAAYTVPLQNKFVERYFNLIDLEIITRVDYFVRLFSTLQTVDVMIVSERLYHENLLRHNIGRLFLLREQVDDKEPDPDGRVDQIAKYASLAEIFTKIVGKCPAVFNFEED